MDKRIAKLLLRHPTFDPTRMPRGELSQKLLRLDEGASIGLFRQGQTTHETMTHPGDKHPNGYRVAQFRHSDDASFVDALVNAWRSGRLQVTPLAAPSADEEDAS